MARIAFRLGEKVPAYRIFLCMAVVFATIPLVLSVVQFLGPFQIWNSRFTFQLGNEATLDRPWLGKIYLVALYSRALRPDDVKRHFYQGLSSAPSKFAQDLVALYTFSENSGDIVHDISGLGPPLDLTISPRSRVRWLSSSGGVEILQPAIIKSQGAATKIFDTLRQTQELSIEVWMTPRDAIQRGPARVVSFSRDTGARNFTLGQEGSAINFRIRTPVGLNGSPLALKTANGLLSSEPVHVIATYEKGIQKLYANGVEQSRIVNLTSDGIVGFGTAKNPIAHVAYTVLYFFPVSFFLAAFLSTRFTGLPTRLIVATAGATGLFLVSEIFQGFAFDRTLDIMAIGYAVGIAVAGAVIGAIFVTGDLVEASPRGLMSKTFEASAPESRIT
jgi:hypothetical protein